MTNNTAFHLDLRHWESVCCSMDFLSECACTNDNGKHEHPGNIDRIKVPHKDANHLYEYNSSTLGGGKNVDHHALGCPHD